MQTGSDKSKSICLEINVRNNIFWVNEDLQSGLVQEMYISVFKLADSSSARAR